MCCSVCVAVTYMRYGLWSIYVCDVHIYDVTFLMCVL